MSGKRAKKLRKLARAIESKGYLRRLLLAYVDELRAILKRTAPAYGAKFPNAKPPCHTCALNPATDNWKGLEVTLLGLCRAIGNDQPFYCHENLPRNDRGEWQWDPDKAELCSGYARLIGRPEAKTALLLAARAESESRNSKGDVPCGTR